MAFVLAIGLVVDDAIVMLENITRHIEAGIEPFAAALKGSREMVFPIIAMTLTLVAVYIPIAFISGVLGSIFAEFALTLAGAVLISGIVALTLTPMMCSRLLFKASDRSDGKWFFKQLEDLKTYYKIGLIWILQHRGVVLLILAVIGSFGYAIYRSLPSEVAPTEDRDEVYAFISSPHDASFSYTNNYVKKFEAMLPAVPEVTTYLAAVGFDSPAHSFQIINLKSWFKRHRSAAAIADGIADMASQFPGINVNVYVPPPPISWFVDSEGDGVSMAVMTSGEYKDLHALMQRLMAAAKQSPVFAHVDSQLKWDLSQFEVSVDREKAADLLVPVKHCNDYLNIDCWA